MTDFLQTIYDMNRSATDARSTLGHCVSSDAFRPGRSSSPSKEKASSGRGARSATRRLVTGTLTKRDAATLLRIDELQALRPGADRRHYRMVAHDFGGDRVELRIHLPYYSGMDVQLVNPLRRPAKPWETMTANERAEASLKRSIRRAKQQVRWLVKAIDADHLLTLSYRENMQDIARLARDWQEFVRLVRQRFPTWQYVMTREYQERGALHIHAAVVGRQDVRFLRKCWYAVVGEAQGNIDVQAPRRRWGNESARWNPHKLAWYLTKYVTKDFALAQRCKRRYWASKGIEIPKQVYWLGATNYAEAIAEGYSYMHAFGVKRTSLWMSDDWRCIWISSCA